MAAACRGLEVIGIDVHIGSQLTDLAPFELAYRKGGRTDRETARGWHIISRLDLGGGLAFLSRINEAPPLPQDYGAMVKRTLGHLGCEIEIEPGGLIAGNAGLMVSR